MAIEGSADFHIAQGRVRGSRKCTALDEHNYHLYALNGHIKFIDIAD